MPLSPEAAYTLAADIHDVAYNATDFWGFLRDANGEPSAEAYDRAASGDEVSLHRTAEKLRTLLKKSGETTLLGAAFAQPQPK